MLPKLGANSPLCKQDFAALKFLPPSSATDEAPLEWVQFFIYSKHLTRETGEIDALSQHGERRNKLQTKKQLARPKLAQRKYLSRHYLANRASGFLLQAKVSSNSPRIFANIIG